MKKEEARTAIDEVVERLRTAILAKPVGEFIGSEDGLIAELGCSRSTVRQVARLLEREGLLRVRRGINGGYFSARPDAGTIEETVASYLATMEMDNQDITIIASALWIEAVRKAARVAPTGNTEALQAVRRKIAAIKVSATFDQVRALELESQEVVFTLAKSNYIRLIFDVNVAFSRRTFEPPTAEPDAETHAAFVSRWRDAKVLELNAIATGDRELAPIAARHSRNVWHERISARFKTSYPGTL